MVESTSSGSSSDTNEPVCAQLLTQLNTAYQHLAPDAQALVSITYGTLCPPGFFRPYEKQNQHEDINSNIIQNGKIMERIKEVQNGELSKCIHNSLGTFQFFNIGNNSRFSSKYILSDLMHLVLITCTCLSCLMYCIFIRFTNSISAARRRDENECCFIHYIICVHLPGTDEKYFLDCITKDYIHAIYILLHSTKSLLRFSIYHLSCLYAQKPVTDKMDD